jgi:hypothetical protein
VTPQAVIDFAEDEEDVGEKEILKNVIPRVQFYKDVVLFEIRTYFVGICINITLRVESIWLPVRALNVVNYVTEKYM